MISIRIKILLIISGFFSLILVTFMLYSDAITDYCKYLHYKYIKQLVDSEIEEVNTAIVDIENNAKHLALCADICLYTTPELGTRFAYGIIGDSIISDSSIAQGGGYCFTPYLYNKQSYRNRHGVYIFRDKVTRELRIDNTCFSFSPRYDYYSTNWYREITADLKKEHQVVWTKPYIDVVTSSLTITVGSGIFDGKGNLIAISIVDWGIQNVIDKLTSIKPTENSFVILYAPDKDYIISNSRNQKQAGASLEILHWDVNAEMFELNEIEYTNFKRAMNNGWILSVLVPTQEIYAEVTKYTDEFFMITMFIFVLTLTCVFYLTHKLVALPLRQFIKDISRLGAGELDVTIEVKTKDELGVLARTFNKMTADLRAFIDKNIREYADKERIAAELSVASKIQASMLPSVFPAFPDRNEFDVFATMLPAREVGGDFYDFFLIDNNTLAVVIADVSGKGVSAALFMSMAKRVIKSCARYETKTPKEAFEMVNNKLCVNNQAYMFVTAFMGYLDIPSGKFTYVNAGHTPPLWHDGEERFDWLKIKSGMALGVVEDMVYYQSEVILHQGDVLFLYTDGITEAVNNENILFGDARLLAAINSNFDMHLQDLTNHIKSDIDDFAEGAEQADDIAMLVLQYKNQPIV